VKTFSLIEDNSIYSQGVCFISHVYNKRGKDLGALAENAFQSFVTKEVKGCGYDGIIKSKMLNYIKNRRFWQISCVRQSRQTAIVLGIL